MEGLRYCVFMEYYVCHQFMFATTTNSTGYMAVRQELVHKFITIIFMK